MRDKDQCYKFKTRHDNVTVSRQILV